METIKAEDLYYKRSNKFNISAVLQCLLVIMPLSAAFGVLLTYCSFYFHHPVMSIFFDMVFALTLGVIFKKLVWTSKVHNPVVVVLLSCMAAILMLYTGWCTWAVLFRGQPLTLFSLSNFTFPFDTGLWLQYAGHPLQLGHVMVERSPNAAHDILYGGVSVKGFLAYASWFLEVVWIGLFIAMPPAVQASAVFSESSNAWAEIYESPALEFIADREGMRQALELGQYSILNTLKLTPLSPKEHSSAKLSLHYVPHSYDFYLTITNTQVNKIDNATLSAAFKYSQFKIVDKLRISTRTGETLLKMMQRPTS